MLHLGSWLGIGVGGEVGRPGGGQLAAPLWVQMDVGNLRYDLVPSTGIGECSVETKVYTDSAIMTKLRVLEVTIL